MRDKNIFQRAVLYDDGSGIEAGVAFDPTFTIEGYQYVEIKGVGDPISVRLDLVEKLANWLLQARVVADEYNLDRAIRESKEL